MSQNNLTIKCRKCGTPIEVTEALAAPLLEATKRDYDRQLKEQMDLATARETDLAERERKLAELQSSIDAKVNARLATDRVKIAAEEANKARIAAAGQLDELSRRLATNEEYVKQQDEKLAEAQKAQAKAVVRERELADQQRELDLTIEKRVAAGMAEIQSKAKADAENEIGLKLTERDTQIENMRGQIQDLMRRAEQGSQQLQGEAQELKLEDALRTAFIEDALTPVGKGVSGADVIHEVQANRQRHGSIIWESKRTKTWSAGWLAKLRDDQRAAKADIAVIVSQALPEGVKGFDLVDGVWITDFRSAIPLAMVLRVMLIEVANAKMVGEGQQTKAEMVYTYLTGPRFRMRVQAIIEMFTVMNEDLDKERKGMTRLWAKREEQIRRVIESTAGMYGDLQGIAGKSLAEIEGLKLAAGDGVVAGE